MAMPMRCLLEQFVDLLSKESNFAIVRTPGRKFPGIVVQGDSLSMLCCGAKDVVNALAAPKSAGTPDLDQALDGAEEVHAGFRARLDAYEACLRQRGIPLPY